MSDRTMTVKGTGKVSAIPDLIVIAMSHKTTKPDYTETLECASAEIESLRAALVAVGHGGRALKTTSFNIQTQYERFKNKGKWENRFVGYRCSHGLQLEFDRDMQILGKTLGAIAESQSVLEFGIRFSVKDPVVIKEQLIEKAVIDAVGKAKILAKASGVSLGAIHHIDYSWGEIHLYSGTNMGLCMCEREEFRALPFDIEPDEIEASERVEVVWRIE